MFFVSSIIRGLRVPLFQDNKILVEALKNTRSNNQKRLNKVYDLCKGRKMCEGTIKTGTEDDAFDVKQEQGENKVREF